MVMKSISKNLHQRGKQRNEEKKVCVHTILPLVHYCITNCVQVIVCPNLNMASNWTAKFPVIFIIPNCSRVLFSSCTSISVNNRLIVIVNGPAIWSSPRKKGRSAESKGEEENIQDYLSDKTNSEALVVNNEKLDQEKEVWNEPGTILYYIISSAGLQQTLYFP